MIRGILGICAVVVCLMTACAVTSEKKEEARLVAYADLEVLYLFVLENDDDYKNYKKSLLQKHKNSESLTETEEQIKKQVLLKIDSAVRYVAKENNVELVVNKSDTLLYGSTKTDITQQVLNELKLRLYRNSPSSK